MAVQNVIVRITASASTRQLREARRELLRLAAAGQLGSTSTASLQKFFDKNDRKLKTFKSTVNGLAKAMTSLNTVTLKLFSIGFAIGAAALAANNALFAAGRFSMKLYQAAMQGLTAVIAAVAAGLATVAAAMNEYTAAVNAYSFKSSPALKNKLGESSAALRNIESDSTLATFGMQALSGAFAGIAKNSQVTGGSKTFLKGLADFAAAGGDPAKQIAAAGEFIGLLQKSGKLDSKVMQAASALGEPFTNAMKKAKEQGMDTIDEFKKMLTSGELARLGGVEGQAGLVGSTLMGQIKALGVRFKSLGVDFGQSMLGPVKVAIEEIFRTIESMFARVGPELIRFGRGEALGGIVSAFEKMEDFFVNIFRKHLAGSDGLMSRFFSWWEKVVYVVRDIVDRLRSLLDGGSVIIDSLIKPVLELVSTTGEWIRYIAEIATRNKSTFMDFGQGLTDFVHKIQELGRELIDTFVEAMPFLNQVLDWAGNLLDIFMDIASLVGTVFGGIERIGGMAGSDNMGGLGGFAKMFGLMGLAAVMRGAAGRMGIMEQKGGMYGVGNAIIGAPGRARDSIRERRSEEGRARRDMDREARRRMSARQRLASAGRSATSRGMGGMGVAAALGIGSMFASEEAQPFMQTGAMVSALMPGPLGMAAGGAIAGFGMMKTARTGKGGALGGAMGGGSVGALIGSMILPGVGTAVGAILGAVVGGVVGYFKGKTNGHKLAAKEAANEYMNNVYGELASSMVAGDTTAARARLNRLTGRVGTLRGLQQTEFRKVSGFDFTAEKPAGAQNNMIFVKGHGWMTIEEYGRPLVGNENTGYAELKYTSDLSRDERAVIAEDLYERGKITKIEMQGLTDAPDTFLSALEAQDNLLRKSLIPSYNKFDRAASFANRTLGMTGDELLTLANEKGVNLYDQTVSLQDQFVRLGLAMNYTADQIKGAIRDIAVEGLERFDTAIKRTMSPQVMDELTEGIYSEYIKGGELTTEQLGKYIQDMYTQFNLLSPDTPLQNIETLKQYFGRDGLIFQSGQQLEGLGDVFRALGLETLLGNLESDVVGSSRSELKDMILKQGLYGGVAFDTRSIDLALQGKSAAELDAIMRNLAAGGLTPEAMGTEGDNFNVFTAADALKRLLGVDRLIWDPQKVDQDSMTPDQMLAAYGTEGVALVQGFNNAIESAFEDSPNWYNQAPEWYTKEFFTEVMGADDTSTPRGDTAVSKNLRATLSKHRQYDSAVTGGRSITSSYRTSRLGSINSDHVTGKAYDLIGQNLGAYATLVNKAGGFAEFHGTGGSRHLHVVPGEGAVGDSTAPYMGSVAAPASASTSTNYYNIEVVGAPGMDVNALADAVMRRIQGIERSNRERS